MLILLFAAGVNNAGNNFAAGVNDTGKKPKAKNLVTGPI